MLIQALDEYYKFLNKNGKLPPDHYSVVKVHYLVSLREDGTIDEIIKYQNKIEQKKKTGKTKVFWIPKNEYMPERTEKPDIKANIIEHRALYLFGLARNGDRLSVKNKKETENQDKAKNKKPQAERKHEVAVSTNLAFLEGINSPVVCAYRNFLQRWNPEEETENPFLLGLGNDYEKSNFIFCLSGYPDKKLHEDEQVKKKWVQICMEQEENPEDTYISQCAVTGKKMSICRVHHKIEGLKGSKNGRASLICFNSPSEQSYGHEQSYNSCISEEAESHYTKALNYILRGDNKIILDDMTIVFWTTDKDEACDRIINAVFSGTGEKDGMDAEQTGQMLEQLAKDFKNGNIENDRLETDGTIKPDVDFYMAGLKPNAARIAVQFFCHQKYTDMMWNMAKFQKDMQVTKKMYPVPLWRIRKELVSDKDGEASKESLEIIKKLMESILYGRKYPEVLLEKTVYRAAAEKEVNSIKAGIIKACINRNYEGREIKMELDLENKSEAYLYGRLFAVLEQIQLKASDFKLKRTVKDAYFKKASQTPIYVFPNILVKSRYHIKKLNEGSQIYFEKLVTEIMSALGGSFKEILDYTEQGEFMLGYYHQHKVFVTKKDSGNTETEEDAENETDENDTVGCE